MIILLLIVLSLSFGKHSSEVRDRAFVQSIEIERDSNIIQTNIKTFGVDDCYVGIGENIQTCLDNAQLKQGKDLFTGHTEIIIFHEDSFSLDILETLVKERLISPNCPVILSSIEVTDAQNTLDSLKSYGKLSKLEVLTASDIIKNLKLKNSIEVPILNDDLSYGTTIVNI